MKIALILLCLTSLAGYSQSETECFESTDDGWCSISGSGPFYSGGAYSYTFSAGSTHNKPLAWQRVSTMDEWSHSSGVSYTGTNYNTSFPSPGGYCITLKAAYRTTPGGDPNPQFTYAWSYKFVTVVSPPPPPFCVDPDPNDCNIAISGPSSSSSWCTLEAGQYTLLATCTEANSWYWYTSDGQTRIGQDFTPNFSSPGRYCVTLEAECVDCNGNGGPGNWFGTTTLAIDVEAPVLKPEISVTPNTFCQPTTVTLQVTNPNINLTYDWYKRTVTQTEYVYIGTGQSIQNAANVSSEYVTVVQSGGACGNVSSIPRLAIVHITEQSPVEIARSYRKSIVSASPMGVPGHFWQYFSGENSSDPSRSTISVSEITATNDTYLGINRYNPAGNCWSIEHSLQLTLDYQPPLAELAEVKKPGYNEVHYVNADKDFIFQYAEYYWVSGVDAYETDKKFVSGDKIFSNGTYYLRGRDIATQTWGNTKTVVIQLRDDNQLNYIFATGYDGTFPLTISSQSKSYFDDNGAQIQSQYKSFSTGYIMASQSFQDELDRTVGSALAAPIANSGFGYQGLFLLNKSRGKFSYNDFNSNDPFDDTQFGTLGWYYSDNNALEPLTPKTKLPYTRTIFYNDGSGEAKMSSGVGEALQIGSSHEVLSGSFPVHNELDDYLSHRAIAITGISSPNSSLLHQAVQTITRDQNGRFVMSVVDKSGNTLMSARRGTASEHVLEVINEVNASSESNPMIYLYLFEDQTVNITGSGSIVIENIITDQPFTPGGNWPAGFYRVRILSGSKTISYINRYSDISYNYYDDAGRLITTISPNGLKKLKELVPFPQIDHSSYQYNHQGWLLSMTETDAGTTQYAYRRDGSIRFSQNAEQLINGRYSYTNYDGSGRPVESGEYAPGAGLLFADVRNNSTVLEAIGDSWMAGVTSVNRKDWVKTHYDQAFADMELLLPGRRQDFLMGAVSWTENVNIITWYSYDDLGRVQWMAQQPVQLSSIVFVTDYTYDFLGNVLSVSNRTLTAGTTTVVNQFHHYYTYDADKRLAAVATSPDGNNQVIQAKYFYYLHGPLKRIELAENLQGIDFVYNINGWLTSINDPSSDPGGDGVAGQHASFRKDVFGMVLDYYESSMQVFAISGAFQMNNPASFHRLPVSGESRTESVNTTASLFKQVMLDSFKEIRNQYAIDGGDD